MTCIDICCEGQGNNGMFSLAEKIAMLSEDAYLDFLYAIFEDVYLDFRWAEFWLNL